MTEHLPYRLRVIADRIVHGSTIADIGSDHALLPSFLAANGYITFAIAGELNEGPYKAACRQVERACLSHIIDVRRGNGLEIVAPGEVDVIVIAGMGGALIARILDEGKSKLAKVKQLVLQPNVAGELVRNWLSQHGWHLQSETIIEEDGHIYEILVAVPIGTNAAQMALYDAFSLDCGYTVSPEMIFKMGPWLLRNPNLVFIKKWENEVYKLDHICQRMAQSGSDAAKDRLEALQKEMTTIKEVITCLRTGTP